MSKKTDKQTDEQTDDRYDEWTDGQTDRQVSLRYNNGTNVDYKYQFLDSFKYKLIYEYQ